MISLKRSSLLLFGLLLTVFVAACSNPLSGNTTTSNTTTGSTNTTTSNTTTTKDNGTTSNYGKTKATTPATPMAKPTMATQMNNGNVGMQGNALINTTQVKLNGKMITVLTNAKGMILYYKLNDPHPASACTGTCATAWPPVLANTMNMNMMVSSSMQLPHKLTVHMTANGSQIEYDGHPLYTYARDMAPGVFTGRGIGNVWYLVSLGL